MSDEELDKVIAPALSVIKNVHYDEAVVIGSVLGQLCTEIKRLRGILNDEAIERKYNPSYGDNRKCKCGHSYYRHFDSYENMEACGCKYCSCYEFIEDTTSKG